MKISDLSDKEVKALLLIQERVELGNNLNTNDFIELIKESSFTTQAGKRLIRKLSMRRLDADKTKVETHNSCIICDWPIKEPGYFTCNSCNVELESRYEKAFGSRDTLHTDNQDNTSDKNGIKRRMLACILAFIIGVILLAAGLFVLNRIGSDRRMAISSDKFAKQFTELIDQNRWKLGTGEKLKDGQMGMTYSIESLDEDATDSYLIVFMKDPDTIVSTSIRIEYMKKDRLPDYFELMMKLADAMYDDLTMKDIDSIFSQMLDNHGLIRYGDYVWVYSVEGNASTFLITDQSTVNNADTIKSGDLKAVDTGNNEDNSNISNEVIPEQIEAEAGTEIEAEPESGQASIEEEIIIADLLNYIGKPLDELASMLGSYEEDESGYYFTDSGVSAITDEDTGLISYMDVEGIGEKSVTLCGLYIGMPVDNIRKHMIKQGVGTEPTVTEDGKLIYSFGFGDGIYELSISLDGDKASLLAINYQGI